MNTQCAMWVQNALLFVNAILIWIYVWETRKIRKASQGQLVKTEALIRVGQSQIESQSRPAITASLEGSTIHLVNIGNGPAVFIEFARVQQDAGPNFDLGSEEPGRVVSYIEGRAGRDTRIAATWLATPRPCLQCRYRSLSGRTHVSLIDYRSGAMDARFYEQPERR